MIEKEKTQHINKCVFLDRDGVLNEDRGYHYVYDVKYFNIKEGVTDSLQLLKSKGWYLIVITNQAGINKGLYTDADVDTCHEYLQKQCNYSIDAFYHSPYHPSYTESLSRKPDSLLFEKAISKFKISPLHSWMVGDKERDLIPAKKLGMRTILICNDTSITCAYADYMVHSLPEAVRLLILRDYNI
ncbi:MAG: HAD-IIIA family hydrolase [Cytophagaceae bacterium]|nr:HAD-IIIA family hydrolase [Cytophagaceae bacterium]MDW8456381.1 HAD-IIIA family hydrolase [Cytophagaceae bacterium]